MNKKYNYYDEKDKIKKDSSYLLPAEINKPVLDMAKQCGSRLLPEIIGIAENSVQCATIEQYFKKAPGIRRKMQADFGMIEGWTVSKVTENADEVVITTVHLKNTNLIKRKEVKV